MGNLIKVISDNRYKIQSIYNFLRNISSVNYFDKEKSN